MFLTMAAADCLGLEKAQMSDVAAGFRAGGRSLPVPSC